VHHSLSVPLPYLVSEDDDAFFYKKEKQIPFIRSEFKAKKYKAAIDALEKLGGTDDECELILAELTYESLDETVKKDTAASALLGWIEENKHLNIKVMDAAEHFGLSEGYLTRTFREEYSLNLKAYIDSVRQKYVCEQLEDTTLSLTEVAIKCGFENHRQLNTFMNYHLGMSPSEYRKSRRKWKK